MTLVVFPLFVLAVVLCCCFVVYVHVSMYIPVWFVMLLFGEDDNLGA